MYTINMKIDIKINIKEKVLSLYNRTTKTQRIVFPLLVLLLISAYLYGKEIWDKYSVSKQAKNIITTISKSEKDFYTANGEYNKDIFRQSKLVKELNIKTESEVENNIQFSRRRFGKNINNDQTSYDTGYSGDFYIETDASNACVVLKYKKNTSDKTTFYASFEDENIFCQGKKCFKQSSSNNEKLCYSDGGCFVPKQTQQTQQKCGNGRGTQTRECVPNCEGGSCKPWNECVCEKGFEWDGETCKQLQTEKDCTQDQCFTGIYCEDREPVTKNITNGSCERIASCQKNKGWEYTPWQCSCNSKDFCPSSEACVAYPGNKEKLVLPNQEGFCTKVSYICDKDQGWVAHANKCVCDKVGTFWNRKKGEAKCSDCTNKPEHAIFTSSGNDKGACSWKCENGYQEKKGKCVKPNGQYLCVRTDLQICTDDFSKKRKLQKDAKKTNEGQSCFVEEKDNVLFYNQKERTCQICQCVDLANGKISN